MTTNSTLQIRIDSKTKRDAKKAFEDMGLDLSSGVKIYLRQVAISQAIPFEVRTVNGFTPAQEKQMIKETEEAIRSGKSFKSIKALLKDLNS